MRQCTSIPAPRRFDVTVGCIQADEADGLAVPVWRDQWGTAGRPTAEGPYGALSERACRPTSKPTEQKDVRLRQPSDGLTMAALFAPARKNTLAGFQVYRESFEFAEWGVALPDQDYEISPDQPQRIPIQAPRAGHHTVVSVLMLDCIRRFVVRLCSCNPTACVNRVRI